MIELKNKLKEKFEEICPSLAVEAFPVQYGFLIGEFNAFSEAIKEYDKIIDVSIPAYNGSCNKEELRICLVPFYVNSDEENKKSFYLRATWSKKEDAKQVWYVLHPAFQYPEYFKDEKDGDKMLCLIPMLSFIFIQIYEQKEQIIEKMKQQVSSNLRNDVDVYNHWIELAKKVSNDN